MLQKNIIQGHFMPLSYSRQELLPVSKTTKKPNIGKEDSECFKTKNSRDGMWSRSSGTANPPAQPLEGGARVPPAGRHPLTPNGNDTSNWGKRRSPTAPGGHSNGEHHVEKGSIAFWRLAEARCQSPEAWAQWPLPGQDGRQTRWKVSSCHSSVWNKNPPNSVPWRRRTWNPSAVEMTETNPVQKQGSVSPCSLFCVCGSEGSGGNHRLRRATPRVFSRASFRSRARSFGVHRVGGWGAWPALRSSRYSCPCILCGSKWERKSSCWERLHFRRKITFDDGTFPSKTSFSSCLFF